AQNFTTLGIAGKYFNFASPDLPIPVPSQPQQKVLGQEPFYQRSNPLLGFDDHRVNPYIQNFNLEIQRELARNLTFEARYVGSKGTHLYGGISINDVNIQENGILNAFNMTRAGLDAPLFDQMLNGLNLGSGVIGTAVSGSASLRNNSIFKTFLANGNVGQFADILNRTPTVTTRAGGLIAQN